MAKFRSTANVRKGQFMEDTPCPQRLNSAQDFPELCSQTYSERISEIAVLMKALQENQALQREFVSVLRQPHRDLMRLSNELHAVQQRLESGCEDIRESDSFFPELLARCSKQSVRDEVQALITATESFRGDPFLSLIPNECSYSIPIELLPATVDCIVSVSDEDISNLFVLFRQIPMPSSAHTFSKPAPSETDSVYCRLLSRIGFTNWRGHLMYEVQTGFCGLNMITLAIVAILSVSTSSHHNH
jgi:hypothetical protein